MTASYSQRLVTVATGHPSAGEISFQCLCANKLEYRQNDDSTHTTVCTLRQPNMLELNWVKPTSHIRLSCKCNLRETERARQSRHCKTPNDYAWRRLLRQDKTARAIENAPGLMTWILLRQPIQCQIGREGKGEIRFQQFCLIFAPGVSAILTYI